MKIQELEDLLEQQRQRAANLEKTKNRLVAEIREITIELENVSYSSEICCMFTCIYVVLYLMMC